MTTDNRIGVLFVCLGNICRSPMAEGLLRKKVEERGLADRFDVDSCGTGSWHVGQDMDEGTRLVLRRHGAEFDFEARQLCEADFERFRFVLAMDQHNVSVMRQRYPHLDHGQLHLVTAPVGGGAVPDPYGGRWREFQRVYHILEPALDAWLLRWLD